MISSFFIALRLLLIFTVLTGLVYPLAVTGFAQWVCPHQANGSLVRKDGVLVGSELLAQKFTTPRYFHSRPSAADYATIPSGASNQGFTSRKLHDAITERRAIWGEQAPPDLLTASASGLDPHISPEAAQSQIRRVAAARSLPSSEVARLVGEYTEPPQFGFLGCARVNVFLLNRALDALQ